MERRHGKGSIRLGIMSRVSVIGMQMYKPQKILIIIVITVMFCMAFCMAFYTAFTVVSIYVTRDKTKELPSFIEPGFPQEDEGAMVVLFRNAYSCQHYFVSKVNRNDYFIVMHLTNGDVETNWFGYGHYSDYYEVVGMDRFADHMIQYPMPKSEVYYAPGYTHNPEHIRDDDE